MSAFDMEILHGFLRSQQGRTQVINTITSPSAGKAAELSELCAPCLSLAAVKLPNP